MDIRFWGSILTTMGTLSVSLYIYGKSTKFKNSVLHGVCFILWSFLWAFVYVYNSSWGSLIGSPLICAASVIFVWLLTRIKFEVAVSAYLLSFGISYALLYIATFFVALAFAPFLGAGYVDDTLFDFNDFISFLATALVVLIQFIFAYFLFRIRRLRNGFSFVYKRYTVVLALLVAGIVLVFASWLSAPRETYPNDFFAFMPFVAGIVIIGAGIIIWIRRGITMFQWRKTMLRNIEFLEQALADEKEKNKNLLDNLEIAQEVNHKMIRRIEAMESAIARQGGAECGQELAVTAEEVQNLHSEYQAGLARIKGKKALPSAKIKEIDNMFAHFAEKFTQCNIDFNVKISGSIPYMTERVIGREKLGTMIGDHLQDALIAVDASGSPFRSVLAGLGLVGDHYEFTVFDSGVPFAADTLARLGAERVTTYAGSGGSGIGFMTTFETMRECGASLVIREKEPAAADYTKSVTIRFDGRNQYIIETYRPGDFPPSGRYEVIGSS